ncbi:CPBP family intramembrane glutamic endopeptidase [Propionicimonas paludicola]|uniref:CPBP family intramembrane glutamic endopeptidase n=1 Tax=Propionicimonas paludicola TaxID=185243 RepID=UPI0014748593|nr:type II CAAX endopeptidase family protein [Propionicimonas paludicola]
MAQERSGWLSRFVRYEPRPGVEYPGVLVVDDPSRTPLRALALGVGGGMLSVLGFLWLAALVTGGLAWLFWTASGSPGTFLDYYTSAVGGFSDPLGIVAGHLGLAMAIPLACAMVLFVHRFHPRWLNSVQPGFRWRYTFVAGLAALVVIGGVWLLSRLGQPWQFAPQQPMWAFLAAILLTAPLQAAAEEYLFRGYLLQALYSAAPNLNRPLLSADAAGEGAGRVALWLARGYQRWFGVIGSALLFAILHTQNQGLAGFLHPFTFGLLAGWLVMRTGGLEAAIAAHVVNNLIAFGYATLSGTMFQARHPGEIGWLELGWNLLGYALFAVVAVRLADRMRLARTTPRGRFGGPATHPVK